jgi:integrase
MSADNLRRSFRIIQDKLQLRRIKFHDLRHTCASMLIEAGTSLVVVQKILRHANYQLTADTYIHLSNKMADESNRVFDHF